MGTVEQLKESIKAAGLQVDMAKAVKRLEGNKDFKQVVVDYYLNAYAAELVQTKAAPHMQDEKSQMYINNQLGAIGHLGSFFNIVLQQGEAAKEKIESAEYELRRTMVEEDGDE